MSEANLVKMVNEAFNGGAAVGHGTLKVDVGDITAGTDVKFVSTKKGVRVARHESNEYVYAGGSLSAVISNPIDIDKDPAFNKLDLEVQKKK